MRLHIDIFQTEQGFGRIPQRCSARDEMLTECETPLAQRAVSVFICFPAARCLIGLAACSVSQALPLLMRPSCSAFGGLAPHGVRSLPGGIGLI